MNIKLISDVHTEFHHDLGVHFINNLKNVDVDVLVIAGDLTTHDNIEDNLSRLCDRFPAVVYVLGNHDCWGNSLNIIHDKMQKIDDKISNLYWLENKKITIDDQGFIGGTLWFDECSGSQKNKDIFIDFMEIKGSDPALFNANEFTKDFLLHNTTSNDIVVTHHLPSYKCVSDRFKSSIFNVFFASNCDYIIKKNKPKYWFHGHTHDTIDINIYDTHIICNPYGYKGYGLNYEYCDNKIITL